jgi:hypothetical protein
LLIFFAEVKVQCEMSNSGMDSDDISRRVLACNVDPPKLIDGTFKLPLPPKNPKLLRKEDVPEGILNCPPVMLDGDIRFHEIKAAILSARFGPPMPRAASSAADSIITGFSGMELVTDL